MLKIENSESGQNSFLHLGFRPFFLSASFFAAMSVALWSWFSLSSVHQTPAGMSTLSWHAHEMIYGYAVAVVAGFLLTAIRNWTGIQTINRFPLLVLLILWLVPRVALPYSIQVAAIVDLVFLVAFLVAAAIPLYQARQWKQMSIWSKLVFLLVGNVLFYGGILGWWSDGVRMGLYTGLYVIVSLILLMARRVVPFFIEKRAGVNVVNRKWVDVTSMVLMLVFLVVEVYWLQPGLAGLSALLLFGLHLLRMQGWYAPAIWREPMLWVLYIGYGWLAAAFLLRGMQLFLPLNPMLAVHAFAVGGLGMVTIGMMARVSLGHTGRDVYDYPFAIRVAFILIGLAAVFRVLVPLVFPAAMLYMVIASQVLWVLGFGVFAFVYFPILTRPRVDGRFG